MTPMFDEFDKELREALASEALPPDGFADRVMARVAETPPAEKDALARPALAAVRRCLPCSGCGADPGCCAAAVWAARMPVAWRRDTRR